MCKSVFSSGRLLSGLKQSYPMRSPSVVFTCTHYYRYQEKTRQLILSTNVGIDIVEHKDY